MIIYSYYKILSLLKISSLSDNFAKEAEASKNKFAEQEEQVSI